MTLNKKKLSVTLILALLGLGVLSYFFVPSVKLQTNIAVGLLAKADIPGLRRYIADFGFFAPVISIALMILQSLVSPLPAFVITFANAWIFGWVWGALYSWIGAMLGAALCFWIAKIFGRPVVETFTGSKGLELTDRFFETYGQYSIVIARLIPVVPFDIISYAAGLTKMRFWSFFWATGLGQLPATIIYSWLGETMNPTAKYALWAVCGVLTLFILSFALKKRIETKLKKQ